MNIEKYKLIFDKILNNKEFDFYKQLVVQPTLEKTFEIISKDITDGDIQKYEQYTWRKIRDYFASQFRKQISIKKKENKIKYYLTMIDFLNTGNSIYELGKMFKLKNARTQFRQVIDYLNKHTETSYDYNDFKKNNNKKNDMTKIEKIQYQKDYEAGLKAFPLEVVLKNEAKQKRSNDKRKMTIAKKAVKESISDYAKILAENEMLKAEINRLKQLKDINSDIPEDCKRKLDEEAKLDKQQLDNNISNNNDIPNSIEDRFQEFIDKKYIGPAEATLLYKGLNPNNTFIPKYKANGYILAERNTTKNAANNTPQQVIASAVMQQYKSSFIDIKDEKLKNKFETLLYVLLQVA